MFTDIVGYTALTQSDETLALALLEEHRNLLRPLFQKHGGREVKTVGDSFLVEFSSVLEAARCAVEIQESLHKRNSSSSPEIRIQVRIGLHLGDLVYSGGDIYGDAVNIASRIEPLAEPGGISASEQVYDQIRNKLGLEISSIGKRELKNVQEPVEVYKIELPWVKNEAMGVQPDGNRIAVLPFVNISPDKGDEYFSDGLTEELISTISNISELSVISRTSIMSYKGSAKKISEIGRELGVGNVLEGSVRKAGNRIRVTVQLIEVKNDRHLWVQNYDRQLDDVFAVQSDIAGQVADALRIRILPNERQKLEKRPTKSTEAYTLYLKGRYYWNERKKDSLFKALEYFTEAIRIDQSYALAYSGMADCYNVLGDHGYMPPAEAFSRVKELATKAIELDPSSAEAHASLGAALVANDWDFQGAEREFRKAIELNSSYATARHWHAILLYKKRRFGDALEEEKIAQKLDPISPIINVAAGIAYLGLGQAELAERQVRRALEIDPNFRPALSWLALCHALSGRYADAEREAQEFVRAMNSSRARLHLAYVYGLSSKTVEARKLLEEAIEASRTEFLPPDEIAWVYVALGEKEKVVEMIEDGYRRRQYWIQSVNADPFFAGIRSDPRIVEIMRRIGLER